MRDLKADLEICNKATPGPWVFEEYDVDIWSQADPWRVANVGLHADMEFIAQAREGWPHAIERAINAEAELAKYKRALELACGALSAEIDKQYCPADVIDFDLGCDYCDNCYDQDESVCWVDFYIMQAQKEEDRSADCDI